MVSRLPRVGALVCFNDVSLLSLVMTWQSTGLLPRPAGGYKAIQVHQEESQCCDAAQGGLLWVCCTLGTHSAPPAILQDICKKWRNTWEQKKGIRLMHWLAICLKFTSLLMDDLRNFSVFQWQVEASCNEKVSSAKYRNNFGLVASQQWQEIKVMSSKTWN